MLPMTFAQILTLASRDSYDSHDILTLASHDIRRHDDPVVPVVHVYPLPSPGQREG